MFSVRWLFTQQMQRKEGDAECACNLSLILKPSVLRNETRPSMGFSSVAWTAVSPDAIVRKSKQLQPFAVKWML
jgi:hypothetical protein